MAEFAHLDDRGEIINVITTSTPLTEVRERMAKVIGPDVVIKPLDQVSLAVKQRYRYWNERP